MHAVLQLAPNVPPFDAYEARQCCNGPLEGLEWLLKQQSAPQVGSKEMPSSSMYDTGTPHCI